MIDPRLSIVEHRLQSVRRVIAFASGKGGVGKSCCSSVAALLLAKRGLRTGLLDLDFHGASDHIILGIEPELPQEEGGILPLNGPYGLRYMGIAPFTGEHGIALRGDAVTDAIRELLAVVIWGELDVLVVDMPPGIGEAILDLSRHVLRSEVILVTTRSTLSQQVMERLVQVLEAGNVKLIGNVMNMVRDGAQQIEAEPKSIRANRQSAARPPQLGELPFVPEIEEEIGHPDRLVAGRFAAALASVIENLFPPE